MSASVQCAQCRQELQVPAEYVGKVVRCPACKAEFVAGGRAPEGRPAPRPAEMVKKTPLPAPTGSPFTFDDDVGERDNPSRRLAKKPDKSRRRVIIGSVLVGVVLLVLALTYSREGARNRPAPVLVGGNGQNMVIVDHDHDVADFLNPKDLPEPDLARDLNRFFDDVRGSMQLARGINVHLHLDPARASDELEAAKLLPANEPDRGKLRQLVRANFATTMLAEAPHIQWVRQEIRDIKRLGDGEVVVIVRHLTANHVPLRLRWWLGKRDGAWKIYDMEDLDIGVRLTAATAIRCADDVRCEETEDLRRAAGLAHTSRILSLRTDVRAAEDRVKDFADLKLPPALDAARQLALGHVHFNNNRSDEALAAFDRAQALRSDFVGIDLLKGMVYLNQSRWDQAVECLEAYRDLLGEDALLCFELGIAYERTFRMTEACALYRKALDYQPDNGDAFQGLIASLPLDDDRKDIAKRFVRLKDPRGIFDLCSEDCQKAHDGASLEALVTGMRSFDPNHRSLEFMSALAKVFNGQAEAAIPLFEAAQRNEINAGVKDNQRLGFLAALAKSGKVLVAYRALADPVDTFALLSKEMQFRPQHEYAELIAAHAQKHPDDNLLNFCRGELHARDGQYALADKAFAAGLAKPEGNFVTERFRYHIVKAGYQVGKALEIHDKFHQSGSTLDSLANFAFLDRKLDLVEALLQRHAQAQPNDPLLATYRLRLLVRKDKIAEAIKFYQADVARAKADGKPSSISEATFLFEMADAGKALEAYQAVPDAHAALRSLTKDSLNLTGSKGLRKIVEVHREKHPDDPWALCCAGQLHADAGNWQEAVADLAKAWPNTTDDMRQRFGPTYASALAKIGRADEACLKFPDNNTFTRIAGELCMDRKAAELEALLAKRREQKGKEPDLVLWQARAKVIAKRPEEALDILRRDVRKQTFAAGRSLQLTQLLLELQDQGHGLDAYGAAPDSMAAFATLANDLVRAKKPRDLETLVTLHGERHPHDPSLGYYRGEIHLFAGRADLAEKEFTIPPNARPVRDEWRLRTGLLRARIAAGKTVDTFREKRGGQTVFQDLAYQCMTDKNAAQLEALIAARRQEAPVPVIWDVEVLWLKKDYAGCLALLEKHRDELRGREHDWKLAGYLVRCLLQLKRTDDAVREAQAIDRRVGVGDLLLALAHASRGDVKQTLAAIDSADHGRYLIEDCYLDEDLGPILRSEPFAAFRQVHPEPNATRPRF